MPRHYLDRAEEAMIAELYQAGASGPDIAALLAISRNTIQSVLERILPARRPRDLTGAGQRYHAVNATARRNQNGDPALYKDPAWLRAQYDAGRTIQEIADECAVAYSVIHYWMKRHGLERRSTHGK